jgi:hypothetical protein
MRTSPTAATSGGPTGPGLRPAGACDRQGLPHREKLVLFALLSVADLSLTWWLLTLPGGQVYEGNPVASWLLARFGWLGLAGFKAAVVALVAGLAVVISWRRPRAGGLVLGFACAALTVVLLHSVSLCGPALRWSEGWEAIQHRGAALDAELPKARAYRALLERAGQELSAGRCTLQEAVDRLAASERAQDPAWLRTLAQEYGRGSRRECLAINLLLCAAMSLTDSLPSASSQVAWQTLDRLGQEFRQTFGTSPPARLRQLLREAGFGDGEASYPVGSPPAAAPASAGEPSAL